MQLTKEQINRERQGELRQLNEYNYCNCTIITATSQQHNIHCQITAIHNSYRTEQVLIEFIIRHCIILTELFIKQALVRDEDLLTFSQAQMNRTNEPEREEVTS